jgi:hypothetical protein
VVEEIDTCQKALFKSNAPKSTDGGCSDSDSEPDDDDDEESGPRKRRASSPASTTGTRGKKSPK